MPLLTFGAVTALSVLAPRFCGNFVTPLYSMLRESWPRIVELATMRGMMMSLGAAVLSAGAAWAWRNKPDSGRVALICSAVAVPILCTFNLVRTGDPEFLKPTPPTAGRIAFVNDAWALTQAVHALMPPNTASALRIHDVGGYDSLLHRDTVAMLRDIDGGDPAPPANGNIMFVKSTADPRKLAEAGVTEVRSRKPLPLLGQPRIVKDGVAEYSLAGPGRASTPAGPAVVTEEGFDRLSVAATGPGVLVVRVRYMPGWEATIDGRPTPMRRSLWREVELPAGSHSVSFLYRPQGLVLGSWAAAAALALLALVWLIGRLRASSSEPNCAQTP
jgi:hypothetical protein